MSKNRLVAYESRLRGLSSKQDSNCENEVLITTVVALAHKSSKMPVESRTSNGKASGDEEEEEEEDVDMLGVDGVEMQLTLTTIQTPERSCDSNASSVPPERETPKVLTVLASVLDRLVARNEQLASAPSQQGKKITIFHGLRAPSISIAKYLERISKYTSCSPSCFVVGYVFLDRLIHRQPDLLVTSLNVHRLLVTSVMVATKMLDDVHFNNAFFARVGGVSVLELNRLELEFLFRLDFKLSVTISVFESYCAYLERDITAAEPNKNTKQPSERVERSLPAFGTVNCAPRTPRASAPSTPKETSPSRFSSVGNKKRPPLAAAGPPHGSFMSRNHAGYQAPLSQYFARGSPPSR